MVNLGDEFWDLDSVPVDQRYKVDPTPLPLNMAARANTAVEQVMLLDGITSKPEVYSSKCYICRDPEFAAMGLPLCRACPVCSSLTEKKGHIPADDSVCTICGYDAEVSLDAEPV